MIIALCGSECSGKHTIANFLCREHAFTYLEDPSLFDSNFIPPSNSTHLPSRNLTSQAWRKDINIVIANVNSSNPIIFNLIERPYFLLVHVDGPLLLRFNRAVQLGRLDKKNLLQFVHDDDALKHPPPPSTTPSSTTPLTLSALQSHAQIHIYNNHPSESHFYASLFTVNFTQQSRLRPTWDAYFMSLAHLASQRTNCMKRHVGCVIARNKRVIATGYNGTPTGVRNCADGGCPRCNGTQASRAVALDLCLCLHAEENAIIEAGRDRCEGAILYTNLFPCILCAKKIVQSRIARVVFETHYSSDEASQALLHAGGVIVDILKSDGNRFCANSNGVDETEPVSKAI